MTDTGSDKILFKTSILVVGAKTAISNTLTFYLYGEGYEREGMIE